MRVKDMHTGAVLVADNEIVVEQFKKHPDRYKEIKITKESKKTDDNK